MRREEGTLGKKEIMYRRKGILQGRKKGHYWGKGHFCRRNWHVTREKGHSTLKRTYCRRNRSEHIVRRKGTLRGE